MFDGIDDLPVEKKTNSVGSGDIFPDFDAILAGDGSDVVLAKKPKLEKDAVVEYIIQPYTDNGHLLDNKLPVNTPCVQLAVKHEAGISVFYRHYEKMCTFVTEVKEAKGAGFPSTFPELLQKWKASYVQNRAEDDDVDKVGRQAYGKAYYIANSDKVISHWISFLDAFAHWRMEEERALGKAVAGKLKVHIQIAGPVSVIPDVTIAEDKLKAEYRRSRVVIDGAQSRLCVDPPHWCRRSILD